MFYICYKSGNGRKVAHVQGFATRELAEKKIAKLDTQDSMHVVESKSGDFKVVSC